MSARASSVFLATLVLAGMILAVPSIAGQETGGDLLYLSRTRRGRAKG
jgi:hypothetical protein